MPIISTREIREVMDKVHFRPAISIVMPFETKISSKRDLAHSSKFAIDKIEQQHLRIIILTKQA